MTFVEWMYGRSCIKLGVTMNYDFVGWMYGRSCIKLDGCMGDPV